jgi:hypothetical protein
VDRTHIKDRWRSIVAWTAIGIGAALLFGGWLGVSNETIVAKQLPYLISGGIGGIASIAAGVGLLVAEDLRSERIRVGRLEAQILEVRDLLTRLVDERR